MDSVVVSPGNQVAGQAEASAARWTDMFARSSVPSYGYAVRAGWWDAVERIVCEQGHDWKWVYGGGMTGGGYDAWIGRLLDGEFIHREGVMFAPYGGGNGMWLSGRRSIRYVCHLLDIHQPRRWHGGERIPTFEELEAEAQARREAMTA